MAKLWREWPALRDWRVAGGRIAARALIGTENVSTSRRSPDRVKRKRSLPAPDQVKTNWLKKRFGAFPILLAAGVLLEDSGSTCWSLKGLRRRRWTGRR